MLTIWSGDSHLRLLEQDCSAQLGSSRLVLTAVDGLGWSGTTVATSRLTDCQLSVEYLETTAVCGVLSQLAAGEYCCEYQV